MISDSVAFSRSRMLMILFGIGLSIAFLASGHPAGAFVNNPGWWPTSGNQVNVNYRWGSNLQGSSAWRTAFEQGRDDWNTRPTKPRWTYYASSLNVWNTYYMNDGLYGKAVWILNGNNSFYWCDAYGNTYGGYSTTSNQRRSTAGHEQGHCFGIGHSNVAESIMRTGRNRDVIWSPRQDDVDALNAKYGAP